MLRCGVGPSPAPLRLTDVHHTPTAHGGNTGGTVTLPGTHPHLADNQASHGPAINKRHCHSGGSDLSLIDSRAKIRREVTILTTGKRKPTPTLTRRPQSTSGWLHGQVFPKRIRDLPSTVLKRTPPRDTTYAVPARGHLRRDRKCNAH